MAGDPKTWAQLLAANSRRRHQARAIGAEPGGVVLVATFRPDAGAAICLDPGGGWRASYFDADGFSGHMVFATKEAVVFDCLPSYADTDRGLLRRCMAGPRFMAGVERSYAIERGEL